VERPSPDIVDLAHRLAERFRPEKIVLFGSHASGQADSGSDIDLLVVMDCPERPVDQAVAIRQFLGSPRPIDVLVRTPAELQRRVTLGDWFLREILDRGIVLYERPHA
jgi:uncharacterized protein